jgi:hypothetical protein
LTKKIPVQNNHIVMFVSTDCDTLGHPGKQRKKKPRKCPKIRDGHYHLPSASAAKCRQKYGEWINKMEESGKCPSFLYRSEKRQKSV